jgi:hypothetical protein
MPTITPFIPTAEDLEIYERMHSPGPFSRGGSATHGAAATASSEGQSQSHPHIQTHTHSTGVPATHAFAGGSSVAAQGPGQQQQPRPPLAQFVLTAEQLAALVIPPRPDLLDRWLCQGDLGYIYAPRGVGKTWMAMALPGAISCRRPLGLWAAGEGAGTGAAQSSSASSSASSSLSDSPSASPDTTPDHIPVLYIDGEMALKHTQYRARGLDLSKVHHLHHEHLFDQNGTCLNIGEAEDRQRITDLVIQQGYQVLILDNLSSLASGIDENKGMDYEPLSHWLLELRRRKITVIVIHHAGRNGFMRGHSKREDACSWIIELRDARQESDPGAKFVSHFAKPSRNTGDPLPDMLWHFTTDKVSGITDIKCELAQVTDYEEFIQHVKDGVTAQIDIAEMMNRPRGTISKWTLKALKEGRISGNTRRLLPPESASSSKAPSRSWQDDFDADDDAEDE